MNYSNSSFIQWCVHMMGSDAVPGCQSICCHRSTHAVNMAGLQSSPRLLTDPTISKVLQSHLSLSQKMKVKKQSHLPLSKKMKVKKQGTHLHEKQDYTSTYRPVCYRYCCIHLSHRFLESRSHQDCNSHQQCRHHLCTCLWWDRRWVRPCMPGSMYR
jgi:hypothetical protein